MKRHAPEMTKISRVLLSMACTRGKNQHERAHGIAITGNFQATSKRIPRDFHNSSLVSSCLLESSQRPEKAMQNLSQGRLQRFRNWAQNWSRDSIESAWGTQQCSWSVLGRPWRALEVPRESPKRPRATRKSGQEHLGARQGDLNQCQVASGSGNIVFFL